MRKLSFGIKIQSYSDVITNSSSELFCISSKDDSCKEIQEILDIEGEKNLRHYRLDPVKVYSKTWEELEESNEDACSGDGGYITVKTIEEFVDDTGWESIEEFMEDYNLDPKKVNEYLIIRIDHNRIATINYIKNNFDVIFEESC